MEVQAIAERLGTMVPLAAVRRGWNLANVRYESEYRVPHGMLWTWRCDVIGPGYVGTVWHYFSGGTRKATVHIESTDLGTIEAATSDELVTFVGQIIDQFGLRFLKDK